MMTTLDGLTGYEKGVVARALLARLIKQGCLADHTDDDQGLEITIPVKNWQLKLLACFSEGTRSEEPDWQELSKKLRGLR
ncbi:MAG: hypothetical protein ACR2QH_06980 [Geminicoccaceae bacterium]